MAGWENPYRKRGEDRRIERMSEKKKRRENISGWYVTDKLSPEQRAARMAHIDEWHDKLHTLNYRTVPLEIPGKMLAALGKLALEEKLQFSEFIERIMGEYLTQKGITWE
jgi:hypothetical protein